MIGEQAISYYKLLDWMYDMYDRKPIGDGYTDAYIIVITITNNNRGRPLEYTILTWA